MEVPPFFGMWMNTGPLFWSANGSTSSTLTGRPSDASAVPVNTPVREYVAATPSATAPEAIIATRDQRDAFATLSSLTRRRGTSPSRARRGTRSPCFSGAMLLLPPSDRSRVLTGRENGGYDSVCASAFSVKSRNPESQTVVLAVQKDIRLERFRRRSPQITRDIVRAGFFRKLGERERRTQGTGNDGREQRWSHSKRLVSLGPGRPTAARPPREC